MRSPQSRTSTFWIKDTKEVLLTGLLCRFEVQMVLKIVRYLGQQGYGTDRLVILTPYLGQLRAIMDALKKIQDSDPVLSDLDSHDLVRAGLMSESDAKSAKKQIRLATIGRSFVPLCRSSKLSYS